MYQIKKVILEFKPNNFNIMLIEFRFVLSFYLFMFFVPTPGLNFYHSYLVVVPNKSLVCFNLERQ